MVLRRMCTLHISDAKVEIRFSLERTGEYNFYLTSTESKIEIIFVNFS